VIDRWQMHHTVQAAVVVGKCVTNFLRLMEGQIVVRSELPTPGFRQVADQNTCRLGGQGGGDPYAGVVEFSFCKSALFSVVSRILCQVASA
jgi:hypothetical protein